MLLNNLGLALIGLRTGGLWFLIIKHLKTWEWIEFILIQAGGGRIVGCVPCLQVDEPITENGRKTCCTCNVVRFVRLLRWLICLYRQTSRLKSDVNYAWRTTRVNDLSVCRRFFRLLVWKLPLFYCRCFFFPISLVCLVPMKHTHIVGFVYHSLSKGKLEMLSCLCYHLTKTSKFLDGRLVVRSFSGNSNRKLRNVFKGSPFIPFCKS